MLHKPEEGRILAHRSLIVVRDIDKRPAFLTAAVQTATV